MLRQRVQITKRLVYVTTKGTNNQRLVMFLQRVEINKRLVMLL